MPLNPPSAIDRKIGLRIRAARRCYHLPIHELSIRTGISARRLQALERGTRGATVLEFEQIAAAFSLPVGHFVERCVLCDRE